MSIAWYVNRLSRMSPREVAHRVVEQGKRRVSRRQAFGWEHFAPGGTLRPLPGLRAAITAAPGPLREAVRHAADRLLAGEYGALGVSWPRRDPGALFPADLWRLDPATGALWPGADRFCFDVSYRHEKVLGDIKYVWEINRLQLLQPLAAAYALFADRTALAAVDSALQSWAGANPPFRGLGWNSGIELALRAVSMLVATTLCGDDLSPETRRLIAPMLEAHLYWIERYPSRFSSANNHLVAELMGAYLLTLTLRGSVPERLRQALAREAGRQILADGIPAEQSPTYGAFTAEMLLLCAVTARAVGQPLDPLVDDRLAGFAETVAAMSDETARVPAIGDDDEGRVLTLCDAHEGTYPASVARAIGGYRGVPTPVPPSPRPELRDALVPEPARGAEPPDGITHFAHGGYTVVRARAAGHRLHLTLDHGPLGYLAIAAHGHADANAIVLSVDGRPILVDPGTYLYHSGHEWRDWFRGTRAHNTLAVNGGDQSTITGPFNWGSRASARLVASRDGAADWSFEAAHDGYAKRFGVDHHRLIEARPNGFVVRDTLTPGTAPCEAELTFQLAPGLSARQDGHTIVVGADGTDILLIGIAQPGRLAVVAGADGPAGGWVSPCFGLKVPAARITWCGTVPPEGVETEVRIAGDRA